MLIHESTRTERRRSKRIEKLHMLEHGATAHDDWEVPEPQMAFGCTYLAVAKLSG